MSKRVANRKGLPSNNRGPSRRTRKALHSIQRQAFMAGQRSVKPPEEKSFWQKAKD